MNKSELDHVWHSVTSALEKEFLTRGWFSPQAARIEQLEAAVRFAIDVLEVAGHGEGFDYNIRLVLKGLHTANAYGIALAPEQDK